MSQKPRGDGPSTITHHPGLASSKIDTTMGGMALFGRLRWAGTCGGEKEMPARSVAETRTESVDLRPEQAASHQRHSPQEAVWKMVGRRRRRRSLAEMKKYELRTKEEAMVIELALPGRARDYTEDRSGEVEGGCLTSVLRD